MILNNLRRNMFFVVLLTLPSPLQIIAEVDIPELQILANKLKPEECTKIVCSDSNPPRKEHIKRLATKQDCFESLVKWICELRTVTKNTLPILKDRLIDIGRKDLIARVVDSRLNGPISSKKSRAVQSVEDSEDYEETTTSEQISTTVKKSSSQKKKPKDNISEFSINDTIEKIDGRTFFKIPLKVGGIILITTILLTCCCTLFIRNKLANLWNKIRGKKKKSKLMATETVEERIVSRRVPLKKSDKKRKRAPSYDMVHISTQNTVPVESKESEEPQPTGCYRCYRKKRKKTGKKSRR